MTALRSLAQACFTVLRFTAKSPMVGHVIFWSWHAIYIAFLAFGLVPYVLAPLIEQTFKGHIPLDMGLAALGLMVLPLASFGLGFFKLRRSPRKLLRLFYGVFAPATVLLLCRLFLVREMTPGVEHVLWTLGLGMSAYLAELLLLDPTDGVADRPPAWEVLRMVGHTLLLVSGVYAGALLAFFALPMGGAIVVHMLPELLGAVVEIPGAIWELLVEILSFSWLSNLHLRGLLAVPGIFLGLTLWMYSLTLFVALPFAMVGLYMGSWRRALAHFADRFGGSFGLAASAVVVTVSAALFVTLNQQPQTAAFEALDEAPADDAERFALLERAPELKDGLLNAYLAPWRYLGSTGRNQGVKQLWQEAFDLEPGRAEPVQWAFNVVAAPLIYDGDSTSGDSDRADKVYTRVFDQSIQEAERDAVLQAVTSTWDTDEVEAGLLNVGQRKVHLDRQAITVVEHGDFAEVEIHEVYTNQTLDQQEILYLFNLPTTAAVTGLWLGDTGDRSVAFPFTVAPRGAAQAVYAAERDRRVDPALLEQLGPRQYRLRAFPIPPKEDSRFDEAPEFHLWMTYTVMAQGDVYPLPALAEARNVYWDDDTERAVNGEAVADTDEWLWAVLEAEGEVEKRAHDVEVGGFRVRAEPITAEWGADLEGQRYAVVLDTSYSMNAHTEAADEALDWIRETIAPANDVDLFLAHSVYRGEPSAWADLSTFDLSATPLYGGSSHDQVLRAFAAAQGARDYDAVVVLTDAGGSVLVQDGLELELGAPLWMVHFGGLPPSYDDGTLDAIQASEGGAVERVQAVFQRQSLLAGAPPEVLDVSDGYSWSLESSKDDGNIDGNIGGSVESDDAFMPLAARQLVLGLSRLELGRSNETLDIIHGVAVEHAIATPYSSMIVLVNDEQRERLKKASEAEDRFDRESESGVEQLSKPSSGMEVSGAPEPEEWLLILLACGMLFQVYRQRQLSPA